MMYPLTHPPYIDLSPTMKGNQPQILLMALTVKKNFMSKHMQYVYIYLFLYVYIITRKHKHKINFKGDKNKTVFFQ